MRGVDDEDGMKFKADRLRLDIADTSEKQCGEEFAIGQPAAKASANFFEQFFTRSVFEETDERFDIGVEADDFGIELGFRGGDAGQAGEKRQIAEAQGGA